MRKFLAKYTGFTEEEVQALCRTYNSDFEKVKRWYDGYLLEEYQVYNPKAVVEVMTWINIRATGQKRARMNQLYR